MQGETRGGGITLRRKAEQTLESSMLPPEKLSTEDAQRLIHELRVHRIELEMQNEELRRVQNELEISRSRYADLYDFAPVGYLTLKKNGQIVELNLTAAAQLGTERTHLIDTHFQNSIFSSDKAAFLLHLKLVFERQERQISEVRLSPKDGEQFHARLESIHIERENGVGLCRTIMSDITLRKSGEAEHKRLMSAIEQVGEAIVITSAQGIIQFVNPAFEQTTGYTAGEAIGRNSRILKSGKQDELFYRNLWSTISGGKTWVGRMVNKRKDGTLYTEDATISPVCDAAGRIVNYVAVKRDITEHLALAAQLQQAQKMEAVGRLAGGVAHDYNNMLGVILGYTEMAMNKVGPVDPLHAHLEQIYKAAMRSTDITRQLLAFARKQTVVPVVLDLNRNVESMLKMLRRLIGEDIELAWLPETGLWPVKMDPGQLDQILANLCVNAKDAIADGGRITIETGNAVFEETCCANDSGFVAGEYALLSVSDNGCGMDQEIRDHIFEPFFTGKGMGEGTGMGLSTVYGIVKQNNGFINVYSEPGEGTTIRVYLPRHAGQAGDTRREKTTESPPGHSETVLVVEDQPELLRMAQMMLEKLGYRVLSAGTPNDAMGLAGEHAGDIQLLITDVVMPEMNGRDLADRMQSLYPGMKILFMSGYTADVIGNRGVLYGDVNFIQKPYSMKDLAVKVRECLDKD
jgi:two-component system cell cycle sensor histidine kinase/response regulator CckA